MLVFRRKAAHDEGLPSLQPNGVDVMVLCPVAIAVGCAKCPIVNHCPLKSVLGNFVQPLPASPAPAVAKRMPAAPVRPRANARPQRKKKK
jgi:hypothetical protein